MQRKKTKKNKRAKNIRLVAFVKFVAFISPLVIYLLFISYICPAPNSGFIVLGVVGSFAVGLGMVNIAGSLDQLYLGHLVTLIALIVGTILIAASSLVIYTPSIYSQLNEDNVSFYFIIFSVLVVTVIYYLFFRHAVTLYLCSGGMSKTSVKKAMVGLRNYWWYDSLKDDMSNQWIYWVNKLYTLIFPCTFTVHLCMGWWKKMFPIITTSTCLLLGLNFIMYWLNFSTWDYAKVKHKKTSPLFLLGGFVFPAAACFAIVKYLTQIW